MQDTQWLTFFFPIQIQSAWHYSNEVQSVHDVDCHSTQKHGTFFALLHDILAIKVLVATTDAQWEGMGDVGSVGTSRHYFPHAWP